MDVLQTWLIVGVPGLIVTGAAFAGREQWRSMLGYVVLAVLVVTFLTVPQDVISAAAVGLIAFFLVAVGKGTARDNAPDHHENRKRYTVARDGNH
jgi:Sec-independent protein secretion pathway component TatC